MGKDNLKKETEWVKENDSWKMVGFDLYITLGVSKSFKIYSGISPELEIIIKIKINIFNPEITGKTEL